FSGVWCGVDRSGYGFEIQRAPASGVSSSEVTSGGQPESAFDEVAGSRAQRHHGRSVGQTHRPGVRPVLDGLDTGHCPHPEVVEKVRSEERRVGKAGRWRPAKVEVEGGDG